MTYLLVLGLCFAALFVVGLVSRRQLGVAILALAAGSVLADLWAVGLTPALAKAGLVLTHPPMHNIAGAILILLPALMVMFRLPRARNWVSGIVSSLVWALAAVLFMYPDFSEAVILDDASASLVEQGTAYIPVALTACLVFGVITTVFHRKKAPVDAGKGRHKK